MKIGEKGVMEGDQPQSVPQVATADQLTQLLQVMLMREQRLSQQEEELQKRINARKEQYKRNSESDTTNVIDTQRACLHLKGGRSRMAKQNKDYAFSLHTFIDNTSRIKCLICGMKWFPYDTREWLVRNGRAIRNHTGLGWADVLNLFGTSTTNTPTAAEIPISFAPIAQPGTDAARAKDLIKEAKAKE
jgi:hypothetical protein